MSRYDPTELDRLSSELAMQVDSVARALIPDGKLEGRGAEWKGELATCGKVSVVLTGAKAGRVGFWGGRSSDGKEGGTLLSLFQEVYGRVEGIKEAKRFAGWQVEGGEVDHAERERRREHFEARQRRQREKEAREQARKLETAAGIWRSTEPLAGSLAESYLLGRGLEGVVEDNLRFHPSLPYPGGSAHPALVARVQGTDGRGVGVWRIFLSPDGQRKADVENAKLGLGHVAGGAVRLGGEGTTIGIAEGVETALAARALDRRYPIWAGLSTSGIIGFEPPSFVRRVLIYPDGDIGKWRNGAVQAAPGLRAAETLRDRLPRDGIDCNIIEPPLDGDYLDVLQSVIGKEIR